MRPLMNGADTSGDSWQVGPMVGFTSQATPAPTGRKLSEGLPDVDVGKIGLAVTAANPKPGVRNH